MADHLNHSRSIGFQVKKGTNNAQPKATRPFQPLGTPVTNSARSGAPQPAIYRGTVRK